MRKPASVAALNDLGRRRLSTNFYMRDFLYSEVAAFHGLANIPDDPELAVAVGTRLCETLLEPLQATFGRIAIRSAYRSTEVNGLANARQRAGAKGYACADNEANYARHIWDRRDRGGGMGATACIVVPSFWDRYRASGDWQRIAWWIHDHLPYSTLEFFPTYWAFNIGWHDHPERSIYSFAEPRGWLTRPGMANNGIGHDALWQGIVAPAAEPGRDPII